MRMCDIRLLRSLYRISAIERKIRVRVAHMNNYLTLCTHPSAFCSARSAYARLFLSPLARSALCGCNKSSAQCTWWLLLDFAFLFFLSTLSYLINKNQKYSGACGRARAPARVCDAHALTGAHKVCRSIIFQSTSLVFWGGINSFIKQGLEGSTTKFSTRHNWL